MSRDLGFCLAASFIVVACGGGSGASGVGVVIPPSTPPVAAGCPSVPNAILKDTALTANCTYANMFVIQKSNVTLDCNGATIDGQNRLAFGIKVDSAGQPLRNVTIQNCVLVNQTGHGIYVGWDLPNSQKIPRYTRDALYSMTPQNVTIKNTSILNSQGSGIFLADYVTQATLDNVHVEGAGAMGLYMESATKMNTVKNSRFIRNGWLQGREGIAIDASAQNTIFNNFFQGNSLAAITLYKNCWEHHDTDPNSFPRWQHSDQNQILRNQFEGESVGIWIAERQSRDLSRFDCGDPSYYAGIYYLDHAQNNVVEGNTFAGVVTGVIVEDDNNQILNNDFNGVSEVGIKIGAQYRSLYLNRPVVGTVVQANTGNVGF